MDACFLLNVPGIDLWDLASNATIEAVMLGTEPWFIMFFIWGIIPQWPNSSGE
jgi:hypothetical protein